MTFEEIKILARNLGGRSILQTHTSWVILTGEYAYKIKKPVDFGFLDYTTIRKRKVFCEKELELNRRLSPEIYCGVSEVKKRGGDIFLDGKGEVIDYAVKMKELPQMALMSFLLKEGKVKYSHIKEIAEQIANFHSQERQNRRTEKYGRIETIRFNWDENFSQTEPFCGRGNGRILPRKVYENIKRAVYSFIHKNLKLFNRRIRDKKIKDCHGDLHSNNIFITDKIHIFDCIEFNERFRCSDTASEVAFFLMDLEFHKRWDLADYFLDRYLQQTKDYGLLRTLLFYKSYRAFVRGKVSLFKTEDRSISEEERLRSLAVARRYFLASEQYALALSAKKRIVVFFGPPGSGKTYLSQRFREREEGILLASDVIRKDLLNLPVEEHFRAPFKKGIYDEKITRSTYAALRQRAIRYHSHKTSVFLDATFSNAAFRQELKKAFPFRILWVKCFAPAKTILSRFRRKRKYSDATLGVYKKMAAKFRNIKERPLIVLNTALRVKENIKRIEKALFRI